LGKLEKGAVMKTDYAWLILTAVSATLLISGAALGAENGVDWNALKAAKIPLSKGLDVAKQKGKPISAKFEMEDGKLQLSVYTANKGKFSEVIVDYKSGKIAKSEEIKEGDDLTHAAAQDKAMAKAKKSLRAVADSAVAGNSGYRAVSVVPSLEQGKPAATIVLENATGTKTVTEKLD
jgi:major membrane immunogen (membrane-anchored lipoprotein)